jgi:hypothetical protein
MILDEWSHCYIMDDPDVVESVIGNLIKYLQVNDPP